MEDHQDKDLDDGIINVMIHVPVVVIFVAQIVTIHVLLAVLVRNNLDLVMLIRKDFRYPRNNNNNNKILVSRQVLIVVVQIIH